MKPVLVPTTADDAERFFPDKLPWRIRALTAKRGEEILGIGGIAMLPDGTAAVFLEASEENTKKYPVLLHRAAKAVLRMATELGFKRLLTRADMKRPAAERYLMRLGFEKVGTIDGEEVWQWQRWG